MPENTTDDTAVDRLSLEIARNDQMAVVYCRGKLVLGVTDLLYKNVRSLMPDTKHIVLDLTELTDMDSMGIGTLVRLYVSAKSAGCKLELINLGKRIRDLLGITHLLDVLAICGEQGMRMP